VKIAVDATCWPNRRGYGRRARALLRSLVERDRSNRYTPVSRLKRVAPSRCRPVPDAPARIVGSDGGSRVRQRALFAFPTIYSYIPLFSRATKLVMVHDVIAEIYPHRTVPRVSVRLLWNANVALGRAQADALITVSDYSCAGILKCFGSDPARVFVEGEAADPIFRRLPFPAPTPKLRSAGIEGAQRLAIYLSGFSPHKNLEALVSAFARIATRNEFANLKRTIVADTSGYAFHNYFGTITAQVASLKLNDKVNFAGYLADQDVVMLLNVTTVLVPPSLMEGFAVEAAACGRPVISTKATPLDGLLGSAGLYNDAKEQDLIAALETVLSSAGVRGRMSTAGMAAAQRLTWDAAVEQMREVIRKVAAQ
jgi:glycosyltransferase involved in cell wall biosynthesis